MYWDNTLGVMFVRYNDGSSTQWVQTNPSGGGGGGSGTVTSIDVSGGTTGLTYSGGPVTASGTITMAGTLAVANGGTGGTTAAAAQANLLPSQAGNPGKLLSTDGAGVLSWVAAGGTGTVTNVTGTLPITVATGTTTPVIAINAATNAAAGAIEIATLAEAATGTDATLALTPSTGVPKDAATMTGAALIPGGNDAARPGTPVTGMTRYNSQGGTPVNLEYYDGSSWTAVSRGASVGSTVAWVNFTGAGAAAIQGSGNISSVTRVSAGLYSLTFINALSSANYSVTGATSYAAVANGDRTFGIDPASFATTGCQVASKAQLNANGAS
jgi:hypothetical protein